MTGQSRKSPAPATTAIYTHMDFEYLAGVHRAPHPRAARRTSCYSRAKASDIVIVMPGISGSWLSDAVNGAWYGPPAVQLQLFRYLDDSILWPDRRQ